MREFVVPRAVWARFGMSDKRSPEELAGHDPVLHDALSERSSKPPPPAAEPAAATVRPATPFQFQVRTVPPGWLQNALGVLRRVTPAGGIHRVKPITLPGLGKQELTSAAPAAITVADDPQRNIETTRTPTLVRRARRRKQLAIAGVCAFVGIAIAVWLTPSTPTSTPTQTQTQTRTPPPSEAKAPAERVQAAEPPALEATVSTVHSAEPAAAAAPSSSAARSSSAAHAERLAPAPRAKSTQPRAVSSVQPRAVSSAKSRAVSSARPKKSQDPDRPFF